MEYLRIALMAFTQVFLVALQTRNCAQSRYGAGFVTSILIGSTWLVLIHDMVANNFTWGLSVTYVISQAGGWLAGTYLHKRFSPKKKQEDW